MWDVREATRDSLEEIKEYHIDCFWEEFLTELCPYFSKPSTSIPPTSIPTSVSKENMIKKILSKASAYYFVTYGECVQKNSTNANGEHKQDSTNPNGEHKQDSTNPLLSFPWLIVPTLILRLKNSEKINGYNIRDLVPPSIQKKLQAKTNK